MPLGPAPAPRLCSGDLIWLLTRTYQKGVFSCRSTGCPFDCDFILPFCWFTCYDGSSQVRRVDSLCKLACLFVFAPRCTDPLVVWMSSLPLMLVTHFIIDVRDSKMDLYSVQDSYVSGLDWSS